MVILVINQVQCEAPLDIINNIMNRAKMNYNLSSPTSLSSSSLSSSSVRSTSTSISSTEPYEVSVANKIKSTIITENSATVPSIKKTTMQSKIGGPSAIITSTTTSLNMVRFMRLPQYCYICISLQCLFICIFFVMGRISGNDQENISYDLEYNNSASYIHTCTYRYQYLYYKVYIRVSSIHRFIFYLFTFFPLAFVIFFISR